VIKITQCDECVYKSYLEGLINEINYLKERTKQLEATINENARVLDANSNKFDNAIKHLLLRDEKNMNSIINIYDILSR
jgi:uncharacterized protein (UPF0335 family)